MTTLTLPRTPERRPARLKAALRFLGAMIEGVAEAREMASRYAALSRLSDEELARRGLTRDQLPTAIVQGTGVK